MRMGISGWRRTIGSRPRPIICLYKLLYFRMHSLNTESYQYSGVHSAGMQYVDS